MTGTGAPEGGWTIGRVLGLIVGLIGMAGFGACSLFGLVTTGSNAARGADLWELGLFVAFTVPGLGLTYLCFSLVRAMIRRSRGAPRE